MQLRLSTLYMLMYCTVENSKLSVVFFFLPPFFFKLPSTQNKKHWGTDREDRGLSTLWN